MSEIWRTISEFPAYEVSDLGNVRRSKPDFYGRMPGGCLRMTARRDGYLQVSLHSNGRQATRLVHRLVCEAFHGAPPTSAHHAAHGDGDQVNNRADNLRWATAVQNNRDRAYHGTILCGDDHHSRRMPERLARGEGHGCAKLTDATVIRIRADRRSQRVIAAEIGVTQSLISLVKSRKIWAHVS